MDDRELGRRVGYWRRRRGLTQTVFADRIGRSKSWVEKVERGERSAGRLAVLDEICEVLQIDLATLIGEEPHRRSRACLDEVEVDRIRGALERYDFTSVDAPVATVAVLRQRLTHAWAAFEFANYQVLGSQLPELLEDAQRTREGVGSQESGVLLSEVYQLIASTLRKLGEHTLAWLAGDRGVMVARHCGDLAAVAGAGFRIANALLSLGRAGQALTLNLSVADQVEPHARSEAMRALYGHVLLQAAMAAAAAGEDRRSLELIAEARSAAAFVSAGSDHFRLAFEPINVSLHEVSALIALGENKRALAAADGIDNEGLRMLRKERRAALLVDTARACNHTGERHEAVRRLLAAEQIAASEVRCRPLAQATIADLLHRSRGAPTLELARLAERTGVQA